MTKEEQLRICLMLAFQTIVSQGKDVKSVSATDNIKQMAQYMNEFCDTNLAQAFPADTIKVVDDKWAAKVDAAINNHIDELSKKEVTRLPEDRETLIQFYDRLQQRRMRREQWLFYANATEDQLADKVLKCLDEEIAERQKAQ